jgi:hypothetical protein
MCGESLGPPAGNRKITAILRDCTNGSGIVAGFPPGISIDAIRVNLERITRRMIFYR